MRAGDRRRNAGFTLPGLLAAVTISLLGVQAALTVASQARQREQERELVRIGSAYAIALERYRRVSPGSDRRLPTDLAQLVRDGRFVGTQRHLRRLYDDPLRPGQPWQVERDAEGRIVGVFSASAARPIADGAVDARGLPLPTAAQRYSDWVFRARTTP
jgi:type II secretory pathway pseudopilin PulG